MSNYVRYVHFKLDMPYQISSKELMAYTVLVFNRRTGKYFLKICKRNFFLLRILKHLFRPYILLSFLTKVT